MDRHRDSDDENVDGGGGGETVLTEREIEGALEAGGEERDEEGDRNRRHERRQQAHPGKSRTYLLRTASTDQSPAATRASATKWCSQNDGPASAPASNRSPAAATRRRRSSALRWQVQSAAVIPPRPRPMLTA